MSLAKMAKAACQWKRFVAESPDAHWFRQTKSLPAR